MVGFELVDASMFFDVCGHSSSGGSVCIAAVLCLGQGIVWVLASAVGGLDMLVTVTGGADSETARLPGVWGKPGGCDACQGCSIGSGNVSHHF
jgi:hypothetical protein